MKTKFDKIKLIPIVSLFLILLAGFFGGVSFQKFFGSPSSRTNFPLHATVTHVIDGDTVELDTDQSFRLYGVSCPETGKPFYEEAKDFTQNLVAGNKVDLKYEANYQSDKFGRLLGYLLIDSKNLNVELVRQGFCRVVVYEKRAKLIYQDELLSAQDQAQKQKLGVWKKP